VIIFGESLEARLLEEAAGELAFIDLADGVTLVLTVCVLPLKMDSSSLASVGSEGLKMSFGITVGSPLFASR